MVGKLVFVPVFLNLQIAFGVLDLPGNGDQLVALADADAEQPGQRVDHLHRIGVFAPLAHPRDGIQRVVEKMRVDLGLQRLQLGLAQVDLLLPHGGHQLLDAHHHVPEGGGQLPHLPGAVHLLIGELVGVLFKALHLPRQILQRAGDDARQQGRRQKSRRQHRQHDDNGHLRQLRHVAVDLLVHVADAHHPPRAALHGLNAVNDAVFLKSIVFGGGQTGGVLAFQPRVNQLLLGMIDQIALLVQQKAVAVLADAHIGNGLGDAGKAQVQRHKAGAVRRVDAVDHGDDPGIPALKNGGHVGRGNDALPHGLHPFRVKGQVGDDVFPRGVPGAPAMQQLAFGIVGGDGGDLGAYFQKRLQKIVPLAGRLIHGVGQQRHGVIHLLHVVAHRVRHLTDRLRAAGAGGLDGGGAVPVDEQRHCGHQRPRRDDGDGAQQQPCQAWTFHWLSPAFWRRSALGDAPQYFLKQ